MGISGRYLAFPAISEEALTCRPMWGCMNAAFSQEGQKRCFADWRSGCSHGQSDASFRSLRCSVFIGVGWSRIDAERSIELTGVVTSPQCDYHVQFERSFSMPNQDVREWLFTTNAAYPATTRPNSNSWIHPRSDRSASVISARSSSRLRWSNQDGMCSLKSVRRSRSQMGV